MEKIVSFSKRRGFVFLSSEIYGGFSSCYDYGPLGVELKNNIKQAWWQEMVQNRSDVVGLDAAILMSPKIWQASGHLTAGFADSLVECKKCHKRFRKDEIEKSKTPNPNAESNPNVKIQNPACPDCGGELTQERKFNLMMKTFVGPVEDEASVAYLRAETCQGIYVNYKNVLDSMRLKIPFGIAQIGKAFRNEITPGNFTFRTREFEQMEMQFFIKPKESKKWFDYWKKERMRWYLDMGIKKENLRFREHKKNELAHYARRAVDIEYKFPFGGAQGKSFGWKEIEGIHDRGDWDLSNHQKHSGQDLSYFDEGVLHQSKLGAGQAKGKYIPHVIETSAGADRSALVFLVDAFREVEGGRTQTTEARKETEVVLGLKPALTPIKVAVLPLVKNKPGLVKLALEVCEILRPHFMIQYDQAGSIGRRYRRQDEIGTPFCVTVDFESLEHDDVTLRDRDTMKQERVKISQLVGTISKKLNNL